MRIDSLRAQLDEVLCEQRKSLQRQDELQARLEAQSSEMLKVRERIAALESPTTMASDSSGSGQRVGSLGVSSPIAGLNIHGMDFKPRRKRAGQPMAETPSPRRRYTPPGVATAPSVARQIDLFNDVGL